MRSSAAAICGSIVVQVVVLILAITCLIRCSFLCVQLQRGNELRQGCRCPERLFIRDILAHDALAAGRVAFAQAVRRHVVHCTQAKRLRLLVSVQNRLLMRQNFPISAGDLFFQQHPRRMRPLSRQLVSRFCPIHVLPSLDTNNPDARQIGLFFRIFACTLLRMHLFVADHANALQVVQLQFQRLVNRAWNQVVDNLRRSLLASLAPIMVALQGSHSNRLPRRRQIKRVCLFLRQYARLPSAEGAPAALIP
nr:MAG TPA: hypothetical protein [Caudoviricetes sp.]